MAKKLTPMTLLCGYLGAGKTTLMKMLFGIEGKEGKEFRVAGATDELREKIKKGFDIE